jgi:hypothetical protein
VAHLGWWWLAVGALATFRLTWLVTEDTILDRPREAVRRRGGKLAYFVGCPWCTSIYLAAIVVVLAALCPGWFQYVAVALAFSAVAGVIARAVAS